jgi:hypothetical protein
MGAWGYGNLENDGAQDFLAEISDELFERVITLLQTPEAYQYDESDHDELFVRVEMILAMAARGMINSSPAAEDIAPLIGPYITNYASYYQSAGDEFPQARRKVLEDTFVNLLNVAEKAQGGSFEHRLNLISNVMGKKKKDE